MAETEKDGDAKDLHSLLASPTRDFLVRNDGEEVKIESLKGKKIGLYFSTRWCRRFTLELLEVYNELSSKACFEIVFVSKDEDDEIFKYYFTKMPWLAVPFTDSETRDNLNEVFKVSKTPTLVMVDDHGEVVNEDGVDMIQSYGADAYPFTPERMKEIIDEEDRARREQTLKSVLVTPSRDFVISKDGNKVPVFELEGKTIGLFFTVGTFRRCTEFTSTLVEFYKKLKEKGDDFEIVLISLEYDEESFKRNYETMPWLALPFNDKSKSKLMKLAQHFKVSTLPTLIILGPDGKTRHSNVAEAIDEFGVLAYPFTPEKFEELKEIKKAQTLESLLVSGDLNYVLGKDGTKVFVSDLVGKNILLYFSAHWCSPCRDFTPNLIEVYKLIKEKDEAFELTFISNDHDQESFEEYYSQMPWLALPFGDPRQTSLIKTFKVRGIPTLVALGPTGKTVTEEVMDLVETHGADAYPFTEERMKEIEVEYDEMAKEWPKKLQHPLHEEHELELTRMKRYICDKCDEKGKIWSYRCADCDFDLHVNCALKEDTKATNDEAVKEVGYDWDCDGNVCTKAMAEISKEVNDDDAKDLHSLLSSPMRDFLISNDGEQVKIDKLKRKKIGLYFSAAWCEPCQLFIPQLVEAYNELSPKACFEIVYVSGDEDEESFKDYFTKMPWLAVPYTDLETCDRLREVFEVSEIPTLVIVDGHGEVVNEDAINFIQDYGADVYPFTLERMKEIKREEDRARIEQTLKSVLVTPSHDFVISQDGNKVLVSELEGKTIGLYFSESSFEPCVEFTPKLVEVYNKLKENGDDFEIVIISLGDDEESFMQDFETKPWLALPFNYKSSNKLAQHFKVSQPPTLVILGPDGKTRHSNVVEAVDEHGVLAYPFTPEKFEELKEIEKAKAEAQTLESLLIRGDLNYVLGKDGAKVLVSNLVGKNILLYFSAQWCSPCHAFTPKVVEVYKQVKEKNEAFELIFISSDKDQESFEEYYSEMPWMALPFGDPRKPSLEKSFKVSGIPTLVVVGPTGKTVTEDATDLVVTHGADAYPFTEERMKEIEVEYDEKVKGWPKKLQHPLHEEHELELTCVSDEKGKIWYYRCDDCDFGLHANCVMKEYIKATDDEAVKEGGGEKEGGHGWVCDGNVCTKA